MLNASFLKRREIAVRFLKTSMPSVAKIAASFLKVSKNGEFRDSFVRSEINTLTNAV